jgi:hypothetical protein
VQQDIVTVAVSMTDLPCRSQGESMLLMAPDLSERLSVMSPADKLFFKQVTQHICALIFTICAVLRGMLKQDFPPVRAPCLVPRELPPAAPVHNKRL